jgi:thiamine-phosphate pyrophosphorylase
MLPIVKTHLDALVEDLRLLEILVTGPLGLYSDIKMLRESMPLPGVEDLDRDALRERRTAISGATLDAAGLALASVDSAVSTLDTLAMLSESAGSPLSAEWIQRARRVLGRATDKVAGDSRAATAKLLSGVYVIVDPEVTAGRSTAAVAAAALKGGASTIQLRDKRSDMGAVLERAVDLAEACGTHGAPLIVNDHADVAVLSGATGLHVGQTDLSTSAARRLVPPDRLVGLSTTNLDQALRAQAEGVDYIAIGPVFATDTMGKGGKSPVGTETVRAVKDRVRPPVVAIGGINVTNCSEVFAAGADAVCVASAVTLADDPETACRAIVETAERMG